MTQILVINAHPDPDKSTAGKAILEAFAKLRPQAEVRNLVELITPSGFDVEAEQAALVKADVIVWQFPFYWYSVPAIMKKWIDDVLTHGFAYGTGGTALHGKRLLLSFTTGAPASEYAHGRSMNWPVEDFLPPLLQTAKLCGLETLAPIWSTGMSFIAGVHTDADRERILNEAQCHADRMAAEING